MNNYYQPSLEELQKLWDTVIRQDTKEWESTFVVNWLRGQIKIPQEVKTRIIQQYLEEQKNV